MSIKKHRDMFVVTVYSANNTTIGVFKHKSRITAMKMASAYVFGSQQ